MSVLGRVLIGSAERLDLPDFLAIDSYVQGDFKYMMKSFVGSDTPYILTGFDVINPGSAIGTQNISVRVANSVTYYPGSSAGPFFYGLEDGNLQAAPLVPELRKNSTNYVYLTLSTVDAAKDTRAFWNVDGNAGDGSEFTQDVNTQSVLTPVVNVSVSAFPEGTVPLCKVVVGPNFIVSIEDSRNMMFRLGSGGLNPNPLAKYDFRPEPSAAYTRNEPNINMDSALDANAFLGGDKNIETLKEWMDVVMTKLLELSGTTYWYEDTSSLSMINMFNDALATSIKSKGAWSSSDLTPGLISWSEDILLQSISNSKDIIIRDGSDTLANDQVLYVTQNRDNEINSGSVSVEWFNGINYVNGSLGSFENLTKGDWIKKASDSDYRYLRVEEFYVSANNGGGVTSAGNALSIKLSDVYSGISESKQAYYTQGEYLSTDVLIADRNDPVLSNAGGDLYWLALRSDAIFNTSNIVSTSISIEIRNHDGAQAKCISVAHGLTDKQRITIINTTNFNGSYQVEVIDADNFYIQVGGGPFSDELGKFAYYATVTTSARTTANGFELESANNGFDTDQFIVISGTNNFNGTHQVFSTGATTFTIAVPGLIGAETAGLATSIDMYVRTDLGPTKINQGEVKSIGEVDTQNLMDFIGMDNTTQTSPIYSILPTYNTINSQANFNSDLTDNLTQRVSKLTAMMADKAQDKTIQFLPQNTDTISNTTNAGAQEITFSSLQGLTPTLDILLFGSDNNGTLDLSPTISLDANQVAYIEIDRNDGFTIANVTISNISEMIVKENMFIIATRLTTNMVYLWDGSFIDGNRTIEYKGHVQDVSRQNANLKLIEGGTWSWEAPTANTLKLDADAYIQIPGLNSVRNTILAQSILLTTDGQVAYVELNRETGAAANLAVSITDIASMDLGNPNILIIARRINGSVTVNGAPAMSSDEFITLDGALAEINRYFAQLQITPHETDGNKVRISGSDVSKLNSSLLSQSTKKLLLKFDGAVIDFTSGIITESDGATALGIDFVPFVIGSNEYFWYSISLVGSSVLADNTISGQLLVLPATGSHSISNTAPKAPFSSGTAIGQILLQENGGGGILPITYDNIVQLGTNGGNGGSGTGLVKVDYHDPISTSLPTGPTVTIDGQAGVDGDFVLFSSLSTGNNKIYELKGVGSSITWTATLDFNIGTPEDGDTVIVGEGNGFRDTIGNFTGSEWVFNDTVRYFSGADYWEQSSLKTTQIIDNTTDDIFTIELIGSENIIVDYSIVRGSGKETGQLILTSDGTNVNTSRTSSNVIDAGVELFADINLLDIRLRYTADNSGSNGTIKYTVKRWSNAAGGPGGIPSYSGSGASGIGAAGNVNEVQFHGAAGNLDADPSFKWNSATNAINLNNLEISSLSGSLTLLDNQAATAIITTYPASNKFTIIEYSVERNGAMRVGRLQVPTDGVSIGFSDDFAEAGTSGIVLTALLNGANVEIRYTSTNTGSNGVFKYSFRQWS